MSSEGKVKRKNIQYIQHLKNNGEKISALTAYDFLMAEILDEADIDVILIGDSVSMVVAGNQDTLPVSMDEMEYHTRIVAKGVHNALVVADMPFMSYQPSIETGIENAGRLMKAGAQAVKIEGGQIVVPLVEKLTRYGIPVMAHLGLTPQAVHIFGGYPLQGTKPEKQSKMIQEAKMLQDAGAFSIVLEKIPADLGKRISEALRIPTIGIGAGPHCDGQILVSHDMLGLYDKFKPKFVRRYARLADEMRRAFREYIADVKQNKFPDDSESFS